MRSRTTLIITGVAARRLAVGILVLSSLTASCHGEDVDAGADADADADTDVNADAGLDGAPDAESDQDAEADADLGGMHFVVVTFNTGTSEGMAHDAPPDDGYTSAHAALSDEYYGDGLAWIPAIDAVEAFFEAVDPDIVAFQEVFYSEECATIPQDAWTDFVCERWTAGDPTVAQQVLGEGFQVMCMPDHPDKCAAVNRRFGSFRGCDSDFCLEGLDGFRVETCGSGARVGRGVIDLVEGGTLTLVDYHGSSGLTEEDQACRVRQVEQVFVDLGDGEPGANGERNLVMGDLNTDPCRLASVDPSAARWTDFVGDGLDFHFITDCGPRVEETYAALFNIDHVMSDAARGTCWAAGVTDGHPAVIDAIYFDHHPIVCDVWLPEE